MSFRMRAMPSRSPYSTEAAGAFKPSHQRILFGFSTYFLDSLSITRRESSGLSSRTSAQRRADARIESSSDSFMIHATSESRGQKFPDLLPHVRPRSCRVLED